MNVAAVPRLFPPATMQPNVRRKGEFGFYLLLLGVALAMLFICRSYGPPFLERWFVPLPIESPVDFVLLCAALFGAVWLHECGHLIAALALNFKFLGASFGPWEVRTLHGKWKLSFSARRLFTGSVSAVPRTMFYWRAAMMIVVAAGPMATLAAALAAAGMKVDGVNLQFVRIAFLQVSSLVFLLGLIPNRMDAAKRNDMRLFIDLLFKNHGAQEIELSLERLQHNLAGKRPEDYSKEFTARLAAWRGRPESELAFAQTLTRWALDSGEFEVADAWDAHALSLADRCEEQTQNPVLAFSACLDVIYRDDLESAALKFSRVDCGTLFPPCFQHLAQAARHVALGRSYRAPAEIIRAQYALPPGVVSYDFERMLIGRLHDKVLLSTSSKKFQAAFA